MSVIVKGMKMPENCFECPCCRHDSRNGHQKEQCNLTLDVFDKNYFERLEGRAQNCPLIALPDNHGRLVEFVDVVTTLDEDSGTEEVWFGDIMRAYYEMRNAPTIVEAEGEE